MTTHSCGFERNLSSRCALIVVTLLVPVAALTLVAPARAVAKAEIIEVRKIRDQGAHNAFTDLLHWNNRWWCTFREAEAHVGGDGAIRILTSTDGTKWSRRRGLPRKASICAIRSFR